MAAREGFAAATERDVRAEEIRTLFRGNLWILAANPINVAIVAAVLWGTDRHELLVGWVVAMTLVAVARGMLTARYLRAAPAVEDAPLWGRRFVVGATMSGLLWGIGGAIFYEPHAIATELIIPFAVGGMVAGSSGTNSSHTPAFLGYAMGALLPLAARYFAEGGALHLAMGGLTMVYGGAMSAIAANNHRSVRESLRLRFENRELLSDLSRAHVSLADANRTLEARVAERSAALEQKTDALLDAQRMETVGLLAGGVAHDFNNLLTAVLGNAELLLDNPHLDDEERMGLQEIHRAANRGAILVSQLLTFSRRQAVAHRVVDLNAVVSEVQPMLGRLIGEHIELGVAMRAGPLAVQADPTQLQQVVINLATNARDAMPAGGKLTIETDLIEGSRDDEAIDAAGQSVLLSVRDTGSGMDAETRRKAFHPFFTTKEVGRGTGLGLATVYGIVEQSGGHVYVESEPDRGSCFRIVLPLSSEKEHETPPASHAPQPHLICHGATALLAEDEPAVRSVTARILRSAGLTVLEAGDGEEALELSRRHDGRIDLLVSDIVMAKRGGLSLARELALERPDIRVLLVSGYSSAGMPPREDPDGTLTLLPKPFSPSALLERVARLLAGAAKEQLPTTRAEQVRPAASST
jgi:signal transduction histidine kinase/FixJ family two-component response regulator